MALWIVNAALVYGALGAMFGVAFMLRGVQAVDPAARGSHWGFRVLILPGAAALWPLLLARWARARTTPARPPGSGAEHHA